MWVAVGGREALVGGPLGAVVVNALRSYLTATVPELWPFVLGGLFVGVVLLFPTGLVGLPAQLRRMVRGRSTPASANRPGAVAPTAAAGLASLAGRGRSEMMPQVIAAEGSGNGGGGGRSGVHRGGHRTETILYIEGVTVSFEGFLALRTLNLLVDKGELRFVIGPNGAGKTTLLDVVCGMVKPIQGRVIFEDATDLLTLQEHEIANIGIGRKFQTPTVFPHHTVFDNLSLSLKARKAVFSTFSGEETLRDRERLLHVLAFVGLVDEARTLAGILSHGQRQWLEIGMLLAQEPKLLLIDEPVAGMTGQEREKTGFLLESIARDHTVVVIEHDMEFVRHFSRTVTVLHEGSVLCEGPMEKVQNDPRVLEVYLGREQEAHAGSHRP